MDSDSHSNDVDHNCLITEIYDVISESPLILLKTSVAPGVPTKEGEGAVSSPSPIFSKDVIVNFVF